MNDLIENRKSLFISAGLLCMLVAVSAVSGQSLWIDEAHSAMKALAPTWSGFLSLMAVERGSDLQMPVYMAALWAWEKIFGSSEIALRSLNIPFFVGALAILGLRLNAAVRVRILFILFACTSAFLWAYLNEARPYLMQFFGASLAMTGLYNMAVANRGELRSGDAIASLLGLLVMIAASLSTIFFVALLGVIFLILLFLLETPSRIFRNKPLVTTMILTGIAGLTLGGYYYWTLKVGARASGVGRTNLLSILFCFYELAGFVGLGPGRNALRDNPFASLRHFVIPLALYAIFLSSFLFLCLTSAAPLVRRISGRIWLLALAVVSASLMIVALGIISEFRVLGRHLMPAFPFLLLAVSQGAGLSFQKSKKLGLLLTTLILVSGLISCLELRCTSRHLKDDYRSAAAAAKATLQQGETVWWAADKEGGNYYGLSTLSPDSTKSDVLTHSTQITAAEKSAILLSNPTAEQLPKLSSPGMIILSKTDLFDSTGELRKWIFQERFVKMMNFPAFTIYTRN